MRIHIQRVLNARVEVDGEIIGRIDSGLLLLVGFGEDDDTDLNAPGLVSQMSQTVGRILDLRVFADESGRFHYSLRDTSGGILIVPQFTLYGRMNKGRRPDFSTAMRPDAARQFFDAFVSTFQEETDNDVATGEFGANMTVHSINDGPVTLLFDLPLRADLAG